VWLRGVLRCKSVLRGKVFGEKRKGRGNVGPGGELFGTLPKLSSRFTVINRLPTGIHTLAIMTSVMLSVYCEINCSRTTSEKEVITKSSAILCFLRRGLSIVQFPTRQQKYQKEGRNACNGFRSHVLLCVLPGALPTAPYSHFLYVWFESRCAKRGSVASPFKGMIPMKCMRT
jgi:hypothetical protein